MKPIILSLFVTLFIASCVNEESNLEQAQSYDLKAKVIYLKDGDSFVVLDSNKKEIEVRLLDIDAPELHQAYGKKAKTFLSNLVKGKTVGINYEKKDKYGRILGAVYWDHVYINEEMIRVGYAWHFTRFSTEQRLQRIENSARKKRIGLWQDENPKAPWEWRKKN